MCKKGLLVLMVWLPMGTMWGMQMRIIGEGERSVEVNEGMRIRFSVDEGKMYVSNGDSIETFTLDEVQLLKFAFAGEANLKFVEGNSGERCWIDEDGNIRFSGVETDGKNIEIYNAEGKRISNCTQKGIYFVKLGDMVFKVLRK